MAAISSLQSAPELAFSTLTKRKNWAAKEPGVIVVFAIVGTVAIFLISLFAYRKIQAKRVAKEVV
ncbi:hypothetical protein P152DRAFT_390596 [Eremomyces bilateralis CBS 781.70]|uniref:Uncharacterized protein n=1 Tax=Eremomyces bilateralis CBS 781.70 TaxID=1392243 RepID=A0A6G1GCI0_9PEZI|nr:uncharacterized protein P152DRAFT_390596 [Eremomyces bilateralis CBS 781.70]KAF1815702.1 hypothetical protein P152DRAFT_390596 [Eremomyces bilateralis CBS 781.70]